jgi:hypothetical protein
MTMSSRSPEKRPKGGSSGSSDSRASGRKMGYDDRRVPCLLARIGTPGGPVGLAQGSLVGCQGEFRSCPRYRPGRRVWAGSGLGSCLSPSQGRRPGKRRLLVQARAPASSGELARRRMASNHHRLAAPPRKLAIRIIPTGEIMGLLPTQGDEKRLLFSNYSPWRHRSSLCHLDRSAGEWRDLRFQRSVLGSAF